MPANNKWAIPETIEPTTTRCFQIHIPNDEQHIAAFIGNLLTLKRAWNWEDSFGDGSTVAYLWRGIIDDAIGCFNQDGCCMPILRQNPTNECEVQQSYDCGETWESLINLDECVTAAVQPILDANSKQLVNDLFEMYDGTPQSINPNLVYDATDDDIWRDYALCNALQIFIKGMVDAEVDRRLVNADFWEDVGQSLQLAAGVLTALPIPGSRFLAAGAAFLGTFIRLVAPLWEAVNILALQDDGAVEDVGCAMFQAMKGATPTSSSFQSSLDSPGFSPISNAALIANAVRPMLADLGSYLGFLTLWSELLPFAEGGFIDTCICPDPGWTVKFLNGATRPPNWVIIPVPDHDDTAYNNPGDYWFTADTPSQPDSSSTVWIEFEVAGTFSIDWVSMYCHWWSSRNRAFGSLQYIDLYDEFDILIRRFTFDVYMDFEKEELLTGDQSYSGVQRVRMQASVYEPNDNETTETRLEEITIHGTGTIPPEWAIYEV